MVPTFYDGAIVALWAKYFVCAEFGFLDGVAGGNVVVVYVDCGHGSGIKRRGVKLVKMIPSIGGSVRYDIINCDDHVFHPLSVYRPLCGKFAGANVDRPPSAAPEASGLHLVDRRTLNSCCARRNFERIF